MATMSGLTRLKRSDAVLLHLEGVVAVEHLAVPAGDLDGALAVALGEAVEELAGGAAAEDGDASAVLFQQFAVDAGLVVEALQVGLGDELEEVAVAGQVAGEHGEVVGLALARAAVAGAGGDVGLEADDGLDAARLGLAVEVERAVEGAVVGHGDGVHAERLGVVEELGDAGHPVEEGEFGVRV